MSLILEASDNDIALQEILDLKDPLRHLMQQKDHDLEGVIAPDGLARPSASTSELLNALPQQSFTLEDGSKLKLSFSHDWKSLPRPLEISLLVDAAPGCGGLAWPAGQVRAVSRSSQNVSYETRIILDPGKLSHPERSHISSIETYH